MVVCQKTCVHLQFHGSEENKMFVFKPNRYALAHPLQENGDARSREQDVEMSCSSEGVHHLLRGVRQVMGPVQRAVMSAACNRNRAEC